MTVCMTALLSQAKAESAACCAVAAAGMLHAISATMGRAQFWRNYLGPTVPHMVCLLALIIPRQPQLASKVGLSARLNVLCSPDEDHVD